MPAVRLDPWQNIVNVHWPTTRITHIAVRFWLERATTAYEDTVGCSNGIHWSELDDYGDPGWDAPNWMYAVYPQPGYPFARTYALKVDATLLRASDMYAYNEAKTSGGASSWGSLASGGTFDGIPPAAQPDYVPAEWEIHGWDHVPGNTSRRYSAYKHEQPAGAGVTNKWGEVIAPPEPYPGMNIRPFAAVTEITNRLYHHKLGNTPGTGGLRNTPGCYLVGMYHGNNNLSEDFFGADPGYGVSFKEYSTDQVLSCLDEMHITAADRAVSFVGMSYTISESFTDENGNVQTRQIRFEPIAISVATPSTHNALGYFVVLLRRTDYGTLT